jgi:RadC-like JAB domain
MGCSCDKGDPSAMEPAYVTPKAAEQSAGPRRITSMASEPLLAVYEDEATETPTVFGCGTSDCDPLTSGHPTTLRIERYAAAGALVRGTEFELSPQLQQAYARGNCAKGSACLPWVKYARDPNTFLAGLARAHAVGKIDSAKKIHSIFLGDKTHPGPALTEDQEVFYVVMIDTHCRVRGIGEISRGARDRVQTPIPDILRLPLVEGAMGFIIVHNHPTGDVRPSEADKEITKAIAAAAVAIEIPMFDHVIVGPTKYYSFYDHKLL